MISDQSAMEKDNYEEARILWDKMFATFFERMRYKTLTIVEARHVIDEVILLFRAMKGHHRAWNSVIDIASLVLRDDITTTEVLQTLPYDRSTIYRAINRLKAIDFLICKTTELEELWTINRDRFAILFHASRL